MWVAACLIIGKAVSPHTDVPKGTPGTHPLPLLVCCTFICVWCNVAAVWRCAGAVLVRGGCMPNRGSWGVGLFRVFEEHVNQSH